MMNKMGMEYKKNIFGLGREKNVYSFHEPKIDLSSCTYMSSTLLVG